MKPIKTLTITVLTSLLIMSLMTLPAFASTLPTFTLYASTTKIQIDLPAETTFNGSISTTGTLRFWVNAPNGAQMVNLGLIDKDTTFSFVTEQSGNYTLNFENDLHNYVDVSFSYVTDPELPGSNDSSGTSSIYLLIPIVIGVVGSILIIFLIRRKSRKQAKLYQLNQSLTKFQAQYTL
jgi:hypothetical protein